MCVCGSCVYMCMCVRVCVLMRVYVCCVCVCICVCMCMYVYSMCICICIWVSILPGAESMHRSIIELYCSAIGGLNMEKFPPAESAPIGRERVSKHLLVVGEGGVVVHQEVEPTWGLPQKRICHAHQ